MHKYLQKLLWGNAQSDSHLCAYNVKCLWYLRGLWKDPPNWLNVLMLSENDTKVSWHRVRRERERERLLTELSSDIFHLPPIVSSAGQIQWRPLEKGCLACSSEESSDSELHWFLKLHRLSGQQTGLHPTEKTNPITAVGWKAPRRSAVQDIVRTQESRHWIFNDAPSAAARETLLHQNSAPRRVWTLEPFESNGEAYTGFKSQLKRRGRKGSTAFTLHGKTKIPFQLQCPRRASLPSATS